MVRVEGAIQFMRDRSLLEELMVKSPGGGGMYAGKTDILDMFFIEAGCGEIYDLSGSVPKRLPFSFGGKTCEKPICRITNDCISCGLCLDACPVGAKMRENHIGLIRISVSTVEGVQKPARKTRSSIPLKIKTDTTFSIQNHLKKEDRLIAGLVNLK